MEHCPLEVQVETLHSPETCRSCIFRAGLMDEGVQGKAIGEQIRRNTFNKLISSGPQGRQSCGWNVCSCCSGDGETQTQGAKGLTLRISSASP